MASHRRPSRDLGPAVRLLRETVAAFEEALAAERAGIARDENERQLPDLPTLDQLLACHGVDMERFGLALNGIDPREPESEEPD